MLLTQAKVPQVLPVPPEAADLRRKRKRPQQPSRDPRDQEIEGPPSLQEDEPSRKRPRSAPQGFAFEGVSGSKDTGDITDNNIDPITRWAQGEENFWTEEYFQQGTMNPLLGKKRSSSSLSKKSETSDGSLREGKNPAVKSRLYEKTLAAAGIYMDGGPKITEADRALCKTLLESEQPLPSDSLFRDDRFEKTCARLRNENEAKVIRDISPLLVPSVEVLCAYGEEHLECLIDHVNQQWFGCVPVVAGPAPQPDYSTGCKDTVFTKDQLRKLEPFIKGWKGTPFLATAWMFFPFFTQEVKCGNEGLNIADRQNAHSGSVAVKQIVNLYRAVSRQNELHRKILAFSVSNDNEAVRIYGHYPLINGDQTSFYRHPIKKFDFTSEDGKEKWTAYRFTKNVYDIFVPMHLDRIRIAVDQLPDPVSDPEQQSQQSDLEFMPQPDQDDSQSNEIDPQDLATSAPSSQTSQPFKKPRSKGS